MDQTLTQEEIKTVSTLLKKLTPGYLPFEIFLQTSRLTVLTTLELTPLRLYEGKVQVLLTEREKDDPIWGGLVHIPGTVILASDTKGSLADAIERIRINELGGVQFGSDVVFVKHLFHQTKRSAEITFVHWVRMDEVPSTGKFYDVESLPENIMDHQIGYIKEAAAAFKRANT